LVRGGSNEETAGNLRMVAPPPFGHRSNSNEHLLRRSTETKLLLELQTTLRCKKRLDTRCWRRWPKLNGIIGIPVMSGEREWPDSPHFELPPSIPCIRKTYGIRCYSWTTPWPPMWPQSAARDELRRQTRLQREE
jgi:hypothetical protein